MQQFMEIKNRHPDCIILFRMGDFYETFFEDAKTASQVLGIALTKRGKANGADIPLAGIPYHALDTYLAKLVSQGYKAAIVEQMENPKYAKGVVKRDVVRIVSPGTVTIPELMDEKQNNYLASVYKNGLALVDLSTGEFRATEGDVEEELKKLQPNEVIIPYTQELKGYYINRVEDRLFLPDFAQKTVAGHLKTHSLDGFGLKGRTHAISAAGALLSYLMQTQKSTLEHIKSISYFSSTDSMVIDSITGANLEILKNIRTGAKGATLLSVLDRTSSPMGARLLKKWIAAPLIKREEIEKRLDRVEKLHNNTLRLELSQLLRIPDLERLGSRIALKSVTPRELATIRTGLENLDKISGLSQGLGITVTSPISIQKLLEKLSDEPPVTTREGGIFRKGFAPEVDQLKSIMRSGKGSIRSIEAQEREKTGIRNLKVSYNRVFGYFIEVTKKNIAQVPHHYIRKQTTANGERYITEELKEWEDKVLHAEEKLKELEQEMFEKLCEDVLGHLETLMAISKQIAELDCLCSLGHAAVQNSYTRPSFIEGNETIVGSRHPVVEQLAEDFIDNDIEFTGEQQLMIITGPNMAGKSTVMRQAALIHIMAQMGSYVPAKAAKLKIIDRVFARVGAHDDITHGQSTFMVEMNEVAAILNNATQNSFIIMDEIGRGTSTFDGVSIAWAVAEHIAGLGCPAMFATHYHVLSELGQKKGVANFNIQVSEHAGKIVFERKLIPGSTDKSYGIHVARLAGMPQSVIDNAQRIQRSLQRRDEMKKEFAKAPVQSNLTGYFQD